MSQDEPTAPGAPRSLRCEYRENPLGLGEARPRFFWQIDDPRRGAAQGAYQIRVASAAHELAHDRADVWDSGRVDTNQSAHVVYGGPALRSRQRYYWQVRTWDAAGQSSPWSDIAWFEMGLLRRGDWKAQWIGRKPRGDNTQLQPSPYLRRAFATTGANIRQARLHLSARGLVEAYINGHRVGDDHFVPGWTDYHQRIQYRTYDVTALVQRGDNVLGAVLADGWYAGHIHRGFRVYGPFPMLLAQLEIEDERGRRQTIATDETWQWAEGPIRSASLFMGETYDATRDLGDWCVPGFDASATMWQVVDVVEPCDAKLLAAAPGPPVRRIMEIRPVAVTEPKPGVFIFDLGQNMVGWCRLYVKGQAGRTITLRHAEVLEPDGMLYTTNLRTARQTDQYTLKGAANGDREVYEPRFTFHGFRYVEVTGLDLPADLPPGRKPDLETITGVVLHSDMPVTGRFECSDPRINQLQSNIVWGQRGNFLEVPTDCPQRDERMGWTGDAQVFMPTACFNMDVAAFFTKWLDDVADAQLPNGAFTNYCPNGPNIESIGAAAWGDAGVICPWRMWEHYADRRALEKMYPRMARWIEFCRIHSSDLVRPDIGYFGDWLSIEAPTAHDLINTAYFAHSTKLMADIAAVLDKARDARKYQRLFERIRRAFQREFVTRSGRVSGESQTAFVLALAFDLLEPAHRDVAARMLTADIDRRKGHLSTGFVGVRDLQPTLTDVGRGDVAWRLMHQTSFPSWLYAVTHGATTIWERWDGWTHDRGFQNPGMNSFNHYAYGCVGQWLYQSVAGIAPDPRPSTGPDANVAGYQRVIVRPLVDPSPKDPVTWVKASYESLHGLIETHWRRDGEQLRLDVRIPANAAATLILPCPDAGRVTESDHPLDAAPAISDVQADGRETRMALGAGCYRFACPWPEKSE